MHWIQVKLLDLAKVHDINSMRRAHLVRLVGCNHQSQIDHHLKRLIAGRQLVRRGARLVPALASSEPLLRLPIMGEADCGEATRYADGRVVDYLAVSPTIVNLKSTDGVYVLVARGDSMNRAEVHGKRIEDSDYIIVQHEDSYEPNENEIVVSNIGGLANVKRFRRDSMHGRIVLMPDSYRQQAFAPIIISEYDDYSVVGRVIDVVKGVMK